MTSELCSCDLRNVHSYPGEESEKRDHDVKGGHGEEIQDSVLENRSQQPIHTQLAVVSFELEGEENNANEGNNICEDLRFPETCETGNNAYQQMRPATCRPILQPQRQ
jgi:hypothetical protein